MENKEQIQDIISSHSNCQALYRKEERRKEGRKEVVSLKLTLYSENPFSFSVTKHNLSTSQRGRSAQDPCELLDAWLLCLGRPGLSIGEFLFFLFIRSRGNTTKFVP